MTHEERKRVLQANAEGKAWGLQLGAEAMRQRILALDIPAEVAQQVRMIDVTNLKVPK